MNKTITRMIFLAGIPALLWSCHPKTEPVAPLWARPGQPLSEWMAQSELQRVPHPTYLDGLNGKPKWNYTASIELLSMMDLSRRTGDARYLDFAKAYVDTLIDAEGQIHGYKIESYNIDLVAPGRMLFDLYDQTGDERYRVAMDSLFAQLQRHPRTHDGGFWHKKVYPWQMWLDGLYMGEPFYARYTDTFVPERQKAACYADIVHQITTVAKHTYDPATGVYRHGWDESRDMFWADKETGQSEHCWGRGLGWYVMAMADVLDYLPEGEGRDSVLTILTDVLQVLPRYADHKTKMWYQVLECPRRKGNYLEATGSIMFVYALMKGVREGWLSEKYAFLAKEWYRRFVKTFVRENPDGTISITSCCAGAGLGGSQNRSGKFDYYVNETKIVENDCKAVGPFIWCSMMYEDMMAGK